MKEYFQSIIKNIHSFCLVASVVLMLVLVYQLNGLPDKINNANNNYIKDTITKTVTANLNTTGSFIYFDGKLSANKFKLKDRFPYNGKYPTEIFQGWIIEAVSKTNGHYYIWNRTEPQLTDIVVQGYFFTDNISTFGNDDNTEYYEILYPIIEKQWKDN